MVGRMIKGLEDKARTANMVLPKAGLSSELQPSSRFVTFVRWDKSQHLIPRLRQYLPL